MIMDKREHRTIDTLKNKLQLAQEWNVYLGFAFLIAILVLIAR